MVSLNLSGAKSVPTVLILARQKLSFHPFSVTWWRQAPECRGSVLEQGLGGMEQFGDSKTDWK